MGTWALRDGFDELRDIQIVLPGASNTTIVDNMKCFGNRRESRLEYVVGLSSLVMKPTVMRSGM